MIRRITGKVIRILFIVNAAYNFSQLHWCLGNLASTEWTRAWETLTFGFVDAGIALGKKSARSAYIFFSLLFFHHNVTTMGKAFAAGYARAPLLTPMSVTPAMYAGASVAALLMLLVTAWCLYGWPIRDVFEESTAKEDGSNKASEATSKPAAGSEAPQG